MQHMVLRNRPTLSIGTERLACLNSPPGVQLGTLAYAAGPGFSTLPSFLLPEIAFFRTFPTNPTKVLGLNQNARLLQQAFMYGDRLFACLLVTILKKNTTKMCKLPKSHCHKIWTISTYKQNHIHCLENINSSKQIEKKERFHPQTIITSYESQGTAENLSTQQSWLHNHKFKGVLLYLWDSVTSFPVCLITWLITCKLYYTENRPRMWNWLICIWS